MRALRLFCRWPFFGLVLGDRLTVVVLCRGGFLWRGYRGWRMYDRVGPSVVLRLGPLVVNYLPPRRGRR